MKHKKIIYLFVFWIALNILSCQNQIKPTEQEILTAIDTFLEKNEKPNFVFIAEGSINFSDWHVQSLIKKYHKLKKEGLIKFEKKGQNNSRVKNDYGLQGAFIPDPKLKIYEVSLTEKAKSYVIQASNGKISVKSGFLSTKYAKIGKIEARAEQTYKVEIELTYEKTPFAILEALADKRIKRAYLLRKSEQKIWEVENELR